MSAAKTTRWLDLLAFLTHQGDPATRKEIFNHVEAYRRSIAPGSPQSPESVRRKFERDKDELRNLGVPIKTVNIEGAVSTDASKAYQLAPATADSWLGQLASWVVRARRCLELVYSEDGTGSGSAYVVHPYEVVDTRERIFIVGWCEGVGRWRRFPIEWVTEARPIDRSFEPRPDFDPTGDWGQPLRGSEPVQQTVTSRVAPPTTPASAPALSSQPPAAGSSAAVTH